jgi:hypothetical protein
MVAMFRQAWFLARKDVAYALRARETLLWTFLMPIVFFYFIGTITSGFGGSGGVSQEPIAVFVPPDAGLLADDLIGRLERGGFQASKIYRNTRAPWRSRQSSPPRSIAMSPSSCAFPAKGKAWAQALTNSASGAPRFRSWET